MIDRLIEFSVRNKFMMFAAVAAACVAGWWSMTHVALDAVPDTGEKQVIVYARWDRSPDLVEDQVTYPIVSAMLGAPKVKAVRGFSDFGYSYVYVIFDDSTDLYWARSRTYEYLSTVLPNLPQGVKTEIGPDATGLGWVYQYVLVDTTGQRSLADMRSYQDWYLRYYLKSVPGVAEVAPLGGFSKQYQVNVDPNKLRAYGISINRVVEAVRGGNAETGGRLLEFGGTEYMVRGRGYAKSIEDFENIAVGASENGTPIRVKDLGQVVLGPEQRRGVADYNGQGEAVSGIVVMRQGENALEVIDRVKAKIKEVEPGMPAGMKLVPVYDRSELIRNSIESLKGTLIEVLIIVSLVILIFLWHVPSAMIPLVTIPVSVLLSFIPFKMLGITANIMSLGGIAIAIGAMVDASIVVVEQTHKGVEEWERGDRLETYQSVILRSIKQVGAPSFFALLVIAVSFLPVLTLEAEEGRLFSPLAYTKSLCIIIAAVLAITLDPALRMLLTRRKKFEFTPAWLCQVTNSVAIGTVHREEDHPISRRLIRIYEPVARWSLRHGKLVIATAVLMVLVTIPVFFKLGSEFMPPLEEGSILYMPSTAPGISVTEAQKLLQATDHILKQFPEVDKVLGKAGRAQTSTDPAPLSMLETVVTLKPKSQWRKRDTWYATWAPDFVKPVLRRFTPDNISQDQLISEMNNALNIPGVANAWTMPVKGRMDMLATGMRTPLGMKVSGADVKTIQEIGGRVEKLLALVQGTRSVFAERLADGYFLDIDWNRDALARYGLGIEEAQAVVESAIGGENISTTIQGRERYPVAVRYLQDYRSDIGALERVLVTVDKKQIALGELGAVRVKSGPSMLRNENGLITGYVFIDVAGRDLSSYIEDANQVLKNKLQLPAGYTVMWSGQYEAMQRVKQRLMLIIPVTVALILLLLYVNTKSAMKVLIVALAVPFSAVGAVWFLYMLGYNMSVGVWVGLIALLGVDAETGVFMLLYLDIAYERARVEGRMRSIEDLRAAIMEGAVKRLRPKFMTVACAFLGLVPIMWATGTGSDVMKRIAAPMIGGIITSFLLELIVYPPIYEMWKGRFAACGDATNQPERFEENLLLTRQ